MRQRAEAKESSRPKIGTQTVRLNNNFYQNSNENEEILKAIGLQNQGYSFVDHELKDRLSQT